MEPYTVITTEEAAAAVGVVTRTIRYYAERHNIGTKVSNARNGDWLFTEEDLEQLKAVKLRRRGPYRSRK